jgi:hypothetical protein
MSTRMSNTDEKKVELFLKGLTIQLQDHLNLFPNLSYNKLASVVTDKDGSMKACAKAEETKRKRIMPRSLGSGGSRVYTPPIGQSRQPPQQYWGNHPEYQ